jgi:hypothetical protein
LVLPFSDLNTIKAKGGGGKIFLDLSFSWVEISLYAKFQLYMLPVSGQKVCGGGGWWVVVVVCKPISVLSFDQAEQFI